MDAAADRYDGQTVEFNLETAFDAESIKWYRAMYEGQPGPAGQFNYPGGPCFPDNHRALPNLSRNRSLSSRLMKPRLLR